MGTPLELIRYDADSGKFEVGKDALAILRRIRGPVGVAAVCGRARQGKSFILNQLLETSSSGFLVAPTHRPCTKGLWMWSTPQKLTAADGSEYHLVRGSARARARLLVPLSGSIASGGHHSHRTV
jgi:hypothetical protein